ncbi:hypothetical protein CBL_01236, partial [Carabus blaptoides fortunei]
GSSGVETTTQQCAEEIKRPSRTRVGRALVQSGRDDIALPVSNVRERVCILLSHTHLRASLYVKERAHMKK